MTARISSLCRSAAIPAKDTRSGGSDQQDVRWFGRDGRQKYGSRSIYDVRFVLSAAKNAQSDNRSIRKAVEDAGDRAAIDDEKLVGPRWRVVEGDRQRRIVEVDRSASGEVELAIARAGRIAAQVNAEGRSARHRDGAGDVKNAGTRAGRERAAASERNAAHDCARPFDNSARSDVDVAIEDGGVALGGAHRQRAVVRDRAGRHGGE